VQIQPFPPDEIAVKILISLGIGLLVGLEREWSHKDLGVRTFTITGLFGMLAALVNLYLAIGALAAVIALVVLENIANVRKDGQLETTTSAALLVTYVLGVLVGQGHVFTPTASAIVMTLLLALKPQLARFAGGLKQDEVRGAVLLGLIGFVIYPVLPDRLVDPWRLLNPREAWLTVILVAAIGFFSYVLLRVYGGKGIYYAAIFGGLVNSTAAVAELSAQIGTSATDAGSLLCTIDLLTIIAMLGRNLILLALFSIPAAMITAVPIAAMIACSLLFLLWRRRSVTSVPDLQLGSPVSIRKVALFGAIFVGIQIGGALGQRFLGQYGVVITSALGGLVSSASATAAVALLSGRGEATPFAAALATVAACVASAIANLPILLRRAPDRPTRNRLILIAAAVGGVGFIATALVRLIDRHT
jgi:uncharacterized membrane protein (DUF4010 family)